MHRYTLDRMLGGLQIQLRYCGKEINPSWSRNEPSLSEPSSHYTELSQLHNTWKEETKNTGEEI
jgi:hypothetical protein